MSTREEAYLNNLANIEGTKCDEHRNRLVREVVGFFLRDEEGEHDAHVFSVEYRCGCCRIFVRGLTASAKEAGWEFVRKVITQAERATEAAQRLGARIAYRYTRH